MQGLKKLPTHRKMAYTRSPIISLCPFLTHIGRFSNRINPFDFKQISYLESAQKTESTYVFYKWFVSLFFFDEISACGPPQGQVEKFFFFHSIRIPSSSIELSVLVTNITIFFKTSQIVQKISSTFKHFLKALKNKFLT